MTSIVGLHGMGQQFKGARILRESWLPAMRDGVSRSQPDLADQIDLTMAFYGDLFRPAGGKAIGAPPYDANDVSDDVECELLESWWQAAGQVDDIPGPDSDTKVRTPFWVQRALNALSSSTFFAGLAEPLMIADLKQVRLFLTDPEVKARVLDRVSAAVTPDTTVVVAHSLGSVVAYEALCAHPEWNVRAFVTLGSPLGIANVIFDRLTPRPVDGRGIWPGAIEDWTNIADRGDVVALQKRLGTHFGDRVSDMAIHNGATAHNVVPYLTTEEAGRAVVAGVQR